MHADFDIRLMNYPADRFVPGTRRVRAAGFYASFRSLWARLRFFGSASNSAASCSVIAPANCSTSVIVTARS